MLRRASWIAVTSNRLTTSAMQASACQSRFGLSRSVARHFGVRSLNARMFQVPISRLSSVLAGTCSSSADLIRRRSSVTSAVRLSVGSCTALIATTSRCSSSFEGAPVRAT